MIQQFFPLLRIKGREMKYVYIKTSIQMAIAALLPTSKMWKLQCLSIGKWINKWNTLHQ